MATINNNGFEVTSTCAKVPTNVLLNVLANVLANVLDPARNSPGGNVNIL